MRLKTIFRRKELFYAVIATLIIGSIIYLAKPALIGGAAVEKSSFSGLKFVSKVIDGDTVIAEGESIRLLGIDADERGYPCYEAAKKRLEELILNKDVKLEKDAADKDQYGRYLRFIFLDGENIDLQMVKEGLAVARFSPENTNYKEEIIAAEKEARENKIGCKWG